MESTDPIVQRILQRQTTQIQWDQNHPSVVIESANLTHPARYHTSPWQSHYNTELKPLFTESRQWKDVPVDHYGIETLLFLKLKGANITKSELTVELHTSLCGKYNYYQAFRIDTHTPIHSPFYRTTETFQQENPIPLDLLTDSDFKTHLPNIPPPHFRRGTQVTVDTGSLKGQGTIQKAEWIPQQNAWEYTIEIPRHDQKEPLHLRAVKTHISLFTP